MKDEKIKEILQQMLPYLDNAQMAQLKKVLEDTLWNCTISEPTLSTEGTDENASKTELFLASKRVEGCSEKSLAYYKATIEEALGTIDKGMPIEQLQQLLGHQRINTTLKYAMVKQSNVKMAHRKFIG